MNRPVDTHPDDADETVEVWVWRGRDERDPDEPDERIEVPLDGYALYEDDPHFHGVFGLHVAPAERPRTLYVYTNDSVRAPPINDPHEWGGPPVERGLTFYDDVAQPFGCEMWGRILFHVPRPENDETRDG